MKAKSKSAVRCPGDRLRIAFLDAIGVVECETSQPLVRVRDGPEYFDGGDGSRIAQPDLLAQIVLD